MMRLRQFCVGLSPVVGIFLLCPNVMGSEVDTATLLMEVDRYGQSGTLTQVEFEPMNRFSDVLPTDWAFQALQSLVERYACLAGYPDGTFRGDRPLTRYEFAASLGACLERIVEILTPAMAIAPPEDLLALERLRSEFQPELETLRQRADDLETRVSQLEANQFSTTTKLRGEIGFSISSAFGDERADGGDLDSIPVFDHRTRLFFDTSFTGRDRLTASLNVVNAVPFGSGEDDEPNVTGTNMTRLAFDESTDGDVEIDELFYEFPVGDLLVTVIPTGGEFNETVAENFNELFEEELTGSISRFGRFNPIYYQGEEGAGLALSYELNETFSLSLGYLAPDASDPDRQNGLFNGSFATLAQVSVELAEETGFGLTYVRAYYPAEAVVVSGETGSELANEPFGEDTATAADHFGLQASARINSGFSLSGWAGLTLAQAATDSEDAREGDDATIFNWAIALAFPDLFTEGGTGGIIVGQPPRVLDSDSGEEDGTAAWHIEVSYRYPINDHISVNPGFFVILNPEHDGDRSAIWVGTIRTVFEF